MLTASSELVDRVVGLELGADDYLGKPFELRELEARIKSVLRRTRGRRDDEGGAGVRRIEVGPHRLDVEGAELRGADGRVIPLTPMEFRTLQLFVENRGRVLTRDRLLDLAAERGWDAFDRSVDLRVSRLRRKIEPNPAEPTIIRTVRGIGYILDPPAGRA
jgi:two-component system phosphate regulon response regulator OmpR